MEHNYLEEGFWAMSMQEELPIEGLSVRFLDFIEDVTGKVLADVKPDDNELVRKAKIQKVIEQLRDQYGKNDFTEVTVKPFYYGNQYFMYVYKVYRDIRLVGAPPSSIGKFGGDTDNWMWPRHTGDFSIFRVYTDRNNQPADYSKDNVPLQPKKSLRISLQGIKEGDFTMVMGFPGRTKEYIPSVAVKSITQIQNPAGIMLRNLKLTEMRNYMDANPAMKLKYAAKYASVANYWKKWIGENKGLYTVGAIAQKQAYEKSFSDWATSEKRKNYKDILPAYEQIYGNLNPLLKVTTYLNEGLLAVELIKFINRFAQELNNFQNASKEEQESFKETFLTMVRKFYKNFDYELDFNIYKKMIKAYHNNIKGSARFSFFGSVKTDASLPKEAIETYSKSLFADSLKVIQALKEMNTHSPEIFEKDPLFEFYTQMRSYYRQEIRPKIKKYNAKLDSLNRIYMAAQMEFEKTKHFYPDANFTMRVAYGNVKGFEPRDGVIYKYNTRLKGVIEKEDSTVYDYQVSDKLKEIYLKKDFGRYGDNGKMPVCFIATNHTTGGNSGSPVFNANGDLIGLNFDRNWEGTMSDIYYDMSLCRNIALDIRYFLFIVDIKMIVFIAL